jgi:hypothetical protein
MTPAPNSRRARDGAWGMPGSNPDFLKGKKSIYKVVSWFVHSTARSDPKSTGRKGRYKIVQHHKVVSFVEAARFWGGQLLAGSRIKQNSNLPQYRQACIQ